MLARTTPMTTLEKLDALIDKAIAARDAAASDQLLDSYAGLSLVNAAYDLFEVDGLYDLASDLRHDFAPESDPEGWMAHTLRYLPNGLGRP